MQIRRILWLALAGYTCALLYGTHMSQPPAILDLEHKDKFIHAGAYAGLAFLATLSFGRMARRALVTGVVIYLATAAFAGLDELTQPPFGRTADWFDWYADLGGAVLGVILGWIVLRWFFPPTQTSRDAQ
jgi:VanZ family protein